MQERSPRLVMQPSSATGKHPDQKTNPKQETNWCFLRHAVVIISSKGRRRGHSDTVTPLAPFASLWRERDTMSYAEDSQVCLPWRPLRPDQGRLQAAKIPRRVGKYETLFWRRACLPVSARSGKGHEIYICYRIFLPRPTHFPTGLAKCLQIF